MCSYIKDLEFRLNGFGSTRLLTKFNGTAQVPESCMMATAAVIGLNAGKRILGPSFYSSDLADKLFPVADYGSAQFSTASTKSVIVARRSSHFSTNVPADRHAVPIKAVKEHVDTVAPIATDIWFERSDLVEEEDDPDLESSLEVFLLLQKSMLEKQWKLSFDQMRTVAAPGEGNKKAKVISSGISARKRRISTRMKCFKQTACVGVLDRGKQLSSAVSPELLQTRLKGYVRGTVSEDLLTHAEVVHLSKKIKVGLSIEEHKAK